jgi:hypothetical protein
MITICYMCDRTGHMFPEITPVNKQLKRHRDHYMRNKGKSRSQGGAYQVIWGLLTRPPMSRKSPTATAEKPIR